ncbi:hypothetical protein A2961_00465 [Candidatus Woesebacteria bacterium RIFCSPLOWO2_01_FULL_39_21]|uniref:N-acetyltransferase domain-containing protein n=1 Tax=Candidatus Woesebacteria bacterium RIFCSPLOWO2_01_FULL_39_21 TaxID=1802519 RepID=A0A1F8BAV1_9BACT|nr:MAG: hypothetical protein A2691_00385 [Candidatus Woesebacteria bacterium RIFCSPHIGHO2_01_FULL_39_23]OGM61177.1 MAG: hypothetical protein A2961_00465 [Candidatus Woesebacteria bacterium RIFCSPLOWO2_01_FULL_39_21]
MHVRNLRKEDENLVKKLVTNVLAEFGWKPSSKYDPDFYDLFGFYRVGKSKFFVMENRNKIIGSVGIEDKGRGQAELRKFFLYKIYRGKGLGEKLIDHALSYSRRNRFRSIHILTDSKLVVAISLYQKKGFEIIKKHSNGDIELILNLQT